MSEIERPVKNNAQTVQIEQLRKALVRFNEDLGEYINNDRRYKLGRILTIIDASISDPEQRKAIKDLVNSEWWSTGNKSSDTGMSNPHTDIRGLSLALGFELYPIESSALICEEADYTDWSMKSYQKTIKE